MSHLFQVDIKDRVATEWIGEDVGQPKPPMKGDHHEHLVWKVWMNMD